MHVVNFTIHIVNTLQLFELNITNTLQEKMYTERQERLSEIGLSIVRHSLKRMQQNLLHTLLHYSLASLIQYLLLLLHTSLTKEFNTFTKIYSITWIPLKNEQTWKAKEKLKKNNNERKTQHSSFHN